MVARRRKKKRIKNAGARDANASKHDGFQVGRSREPCLSREPRLGGGGGGSGRGGQTLLSDSRKRRRLTEIQGNKIAEKSATHRVGSLHPYRGNTAFYHRPRSQRTGIGAERTKSGVVRSEIRFRPER